MRSPLVEPSALPAGSSPWRHLPNVLTGIRMLLVVPLAWMIRDGYYDGALLVAAGAGASDALDGYVAKRFGWQSWLGGILDPIADKLMLLACFLSLGIIGAHPLWLTTLVIGRDVVIVAGAVAYHHLIGRLHAQPLALSKLTTVVQILYVLAQLVRLTGWLDQPLVVTVLLWATVACTLASGIQYVAVWSAKARAEMRRSGAARGR